MTLHTNSFVPAYVVPMLRKSRTTKLPRFAGYMSRVFTAEYDLAHIIMAYGPEFTHWLVDEITAGRLDIRQCVDRWAADKALGQELNLNKYQGEPEDYLSDLEPAQSNPVDQVYAAAC